MSYILVTGCNGFIGNRLTRALLEEGYEVLGISIEKETKIVHRNFKYISIDITDCLSVEKLFQENSISTVMHFAAIAHTKKGQKVDWNTFYRVNTLASKTIFDCAARVKADVIFASTVDVYGACEDSILTEKSIPQPVSDYGISKYLAENILKEIAEDKGINYLIPRFAPVYSKEFMKDAYKRIYLKYPKIGFIIGQGLKYHFLSVNNIIDLIVNWIKSDNKFIGIINVRDSEPIDSAEFINLERQFGKVAKIIRVPRWLILLIEFFIDSMYRITKNYKLLKLRTILYKIVNPNKYSIDKMEQLIIQKWNLRNTVCDNEKIINI
ncbi:MAG TPA: NAD(P)-dependent oxidoreductase [Clostridiaceae bacterium]|nr:NAD(P)-dependent oxidoreductase [Clostridiaceae bacterium]